MVTMADGTILEIPWDQLNAQRYRGEPPKGQSIEELGDVEMECLIDQYIETHYPGGLAAWIKNHEKREDNMHM